MRGRGAGGETEVRQVWGGSETGGGAQQHRKETEVTTRHKRIAKKKKKKTANDHSKNPNHEVRLFVPPG